MADFRRRAETIRQETLSALADPADAEPEADLDGLSRALTNRLLHDVTAALRYGATGDDATLRRLSLARCR